MNINFSVFNIEKTRKASCCIGMALFFQQMKKNCLGRLRLFFYESGIHCGALLKDCSTYQPFSPEMVGRKCARLVAGRHSGTNVIRHLMEHAGVVLDAEETQRLLAVVQDESLRKKTAFSPLELTRLYRRTFPDHHPI